MGDRMGGRLKKALYEVIARNSVNYYWPDLVLWEGCAARSEDKSTFKAETDYSRHVRTILAFVLNGFCRTICS